MSWNGSALLKRKSFETESPVWLWMCLLRVALSYPFASICSWSGYTITRSGSKSISFFCLRGEGRAGTVWLTEQPCFVALHLYNSQRRRSTKADREQRERSQGLREKRKERDRGLTKEEVSVNSLSSPMSSCESVVWSDIPFQFFFFSSGYTFNFTIDGQITVVK